MFENLSDSAVSTASNSTASASAFAGDAFDGIVKFFMSILDVILVKVGIMIPLALAVLLLVMICVIPVVAKLMNTSGWLLFAGVMIITFFGIYLIKAHSALAFPVFQSSIDTLTSKTWVGKMVVEHAGADKSYSFLTTKTVLMFSPVAWFVFIYSLVFTKKALADDKMKTFDKLKSGGLGFLCALLGFWLVTYSTILQAAAPQVIADYLFSISLI